MNLVLQGDHATACQHACLAMLAGRTLAEVIADAGHDRPLGSDEARRLAAHYGVRMEDGWLLLGADAQFLGGLVRDQETLWCRVWSAIEPSYAHAVLIHRRDLYDPYHGLNPVWPWHRYIWSATPCTPAA